MAARQTGSHLRDSLDDVHLGDRISDAAFRDGYSAVADHAATLVKGHLGEYAEEFSYRHPQVTASEHDDPEAFGDIDSFREVLGDTVREILIEVYEETAPYFHADVARVDRAAERDWARIRDDLMFVEDGDGFRLEYDRS